MKKYIMGIFPIIFGVVFIIVGIFWGNVIAGKNYEEITGVISQIHETESINRETGDIDYDKKFWVNYIYDGELYKDIPLDYYDVFHYVGGEITFYVNADHPIEITKSPNLPVYIFVGFGAVVIVMGIVTIIRMRGAQEI